MNGATFAELVEAEAWAQMQLARDEASRARLGIAVHRHDGAVTIAARTCPELSVNRAFALGVHTPATRELVDAVMREYRDAGVAKFIMQVGLLARPSELRQWLVDRGFVRRGGLLKLARSTDDDATLAARGEVRVVEISSTDRDLFEEIVAVPLLVPTPMRSGLGAAIGQSGWRFYLAYADAKPIAGAAMFTREQAAWCGLAATLPAERGRGAQSALFVRRIRDAREAGCRWVTAETLPERGDQPNPSLRNMLRLGFEVLYEREVHVYGLTGEPAGVRVPTLTPDSDPGGQLLPSPFACTLSPCLPPSPHPYSLSVLPSPGCSSATASRAVARGTGSSP